MSLESAAIQGDCSALLGFPVLTHLKIVFFLLLKEGREYLPASPRLSARVKRVKRVLFKIQF